MKRIEHYTILHQPGESVPSHSDSFLFHRKVVDSKNERSTAQVSRINKKDSAIEGRYNEYDAAFSSDTLEKITEDSGMQAMKDDLQSLYDYKAKPFADLLETLVTYNGILDDTCPNCDKDSVETFDHLLPQSSYPEFSDHPLNLMPCCSECNGHKSSVWLEDGKRKYLNLYLDKIPAEQFLFCIIKVENNNLICDFYIDNKNGIEADMFRKINNHFTKLDLLRRYKRRSSRIMSQYKSTLRNGKKRVEAGCSTKDIIRKEMLQESLDMKAREGNNYWQALIYEACSNTTSVFDFIFDEV